MADVRFAVKSVFRSLMPKGVEHNLEDRGLMRVWSAETGPKATELFARMIIRKALDADGKPIFSESDLNILMTGASEDVVRDLAEKIAAAQDPEDLKKPSETSPNSASTTP